MLQQLRVKDFAIIDNLHISFNRGLNVLSGETGAGKSIIVGALILLMGGRASSELVRSGREEATVEALFDIDTCPEIKTVIAGYGMENTDDSLIIRRIISKSGKNKIFINDALANTQTLSRIAGALVDISGQYSQQLLLQENNHIEIVDRYAEIIPLRQTYQEAYTRFTRLLKEIDDMKTRDTESRRRKELIEFQIEEITKADLHTDEEERLLQEQKKLSNAQTLYETTWGSYRELYEQEGACLNLLKKAEKNIQEATSVDTGLGSIKELISASIANLDEACFALRAYADNIQFDPQRLEHIESRIDFLLKLKKKYAMSVEEIVAYKKEIEQELTDISTSAEKIDAMEKELDGAAQHLWQLCGELSKKRGSAALELNKKVEAELCGIGMKNAAFETILRPVVEQIEHPVDSAKGLNSYGNDTVEFFISTNRGEQPKPLSKIASGGEISRIVLAIKKILAACYNVPTLIFDEVDAGIGGAVAEAVGIKLKQLSEIHQVICITHLHQIASFATTHFSVRKSTQGQRTQTEVALLDEEARIEEIARMLGGKKITEKTRAHAVEILTHAVENR